VRGKGVEGDVKAFTNKSGSGEVGDSSMAITLDVYFHMIQLILEEVANKLDLLLSGKMIG
jgi:hypothetical protein